jgi:DNA-binding Lrp family transcriptional regulator
MKSPPGETPPVLDAIDRRILSELQADGRITNVELARRAGISAPPCLRRVRRLEEAGIIRGYHADTDPHRLGWEIIFFAIVGLESQRETVLSAFEQLVATWPEVRECHMIRGGGDFLLKLVARDTAHENQLTQRLTGSPTVTRVQTLQTIRTRSRPANAKPTVARRPGSGVGTACPSSCSCRSHCSSPPPASGRWASG